MVEPKASALPAAMEDEPRWIVVGVATSEDSTRSKPLLTDRVPNDSRVFREPREMRPAIEAVVTVTGAVEPAPSTSEAVG